MISLLVGNIIELWVFRFCTRFCLSLYEQVRLLGLEGRQDTCQPPANWPRYQMPKINAYGSTHLPQYFAHCGLAHIYIIVIFVKYYRDSTVLCVAIHIGFHHLLMYYITILRSFWHFTVPISVEKLHFGTSLHGNRSIKISIFGRI